MDVCQSLCAYRQSVCMCDVLVRNHLGEAIVIFQHAIKRRPRRILAFRRLMAGMVAGMVALMLVGFVAQTGQANIIDRGIGIMRREADGAEHLERICRWTGRDARGKCVNKSKVLTPCPSSPIASFSAKDPKCSTKETTSMLLSGRRNGCETVYATLTQDARGLAKKRSGFCRPNARINEFTCKKWGDTKFALKLLNDEGTLIGLKEPGETAWCDYVMTKTN